MTTDEIDQFRILTVCTGNICRSPAAQLLLARELGPSVHVESAGTAALVASPVEPTMAALLHADGISVREFAARALTEDMVRSADLILTATRQHRAEIVEMIPNAVRRTFTLKEYAHILENAGFSGGERLPSERLRATLKLAAMARSRSKISHGDLDVSDPFGQSRDAFEVAWKGIRQAVQAIAVSARVP